MVIVKYNGLLGNKLYEYCFGRIIAQKLGYKLQVQPLEGFPATKDIIDGDDYSVGYPTEELTGQKVDLNGVLKDRRKRKIIVNGFFQRYEYYKRYKESIRKKWLILKTDFIPDFSVDDEDVIVCIRRGDYIRFGWALPMSYYDDALAKIKYRKIYVCSATLDPFVRVFIEKYGATFLTYEKYDEIKILKTIMYFNKIIISNSTFYWWAAYLSKAKEIMAPIPLKGVLWSPGYRDVDLISGTEKRFKFIICRDFYEESLKEKLINIKRRIEVKISGTSGIILSDE